MAIESTPPTRMPSSTKPERSARRTYGQFIAAIKASPSAWASLPLAEVRGNNNTEVQTAVLQAGAKRGLALQTTIQDGRVYARIRSQPEPEPGANS